MKTIRLMRSRLDGGPGSGRRKGGSGPGRRKKERLGKSFRETLGADKPTEKFDPKAARPKFPEKKLSKSTEAAFKDFKL